MVLDKTEAAEPYCYQKPLKLNFNNVQFHVLQSLNAFIFSCNSVSLWDPPALFSPHSLPHSLCLSAGCSVVSANCSLLDHRFPELKNRGLAVCNTENGQLAFFPLRSMYILLTAHIRLHKRPRNMQNNIMEAIKYIKAGSIRSLCVHA